MGTGAIFLLLAYGLRGPYLKKLPGENNSQRRDRLDWRIPKKYTDQANEKVIAILPALSISEDSEISRMLYLSLIDIMLDEGEDYEDY